jgi:NhaP-type Na+/H+ or K+/H+ antiporter
MSRLALLLVFLFTRALAHPGHDAPEPHVHALWEVWVLLGLVVVWAVAYIIRRRSDRRRASNNSNPAQL